MYSIHGGNVNLEDEVEIVWNEDPTQYRFIREWCIPTQKRKGLPKKYQNKSYSIIGYANISRDAETKRDGHYRKRIFVLRDTDLTETFINDNPAEAIDPNTVSKGSKSNSI